MEFLVPELIRKKREGGELASEELGFLVRGFADGSIPDYQISAWLMAVFFRGMSAQETTLFTEKMKNSGDHLNWRSLHPSFKNGMFADKHSTGGVGDKVSLILAPLAAGLGLKVPMMSGRGLGFTGGTVDKLQSIAGFNMYPDDFMRTRALQESGYCMMAQSERLCPSDRKLYSLRDVTATIESLPLITGSIVSKKWAAGVENIVYDVKCGSAAFMPNQVAAVELAKSLVAVSKKAGMHAKALVTRMEEPLGALIGNAMEVEESVWILTDHYPTPELKRLAKHLRALSIRLAAEMAALAGAVESVSAGIAKCEDLLSSGHAFELFEKNLDCQGASPNWKKTLVRAPQVFEFKSPRAGVIEAIHSRDFGIAGIEVGAGREKSEDRIDAAVGFEMAVALGDRVAQGQVLARCYLRDETQFKLIQHDLKDAFVVGETAPVLHVGNDLVYTEVT